MKKVLKLVKSRKSSSAGSTKGSLRSPSKGSVGQASSIGGESASAASMIYESQRSRRPDETSMHSQSSQNQVPNSQAPVGIVSITMKICHVIFILYIITILFSISVLVVIVHLYYRQNTISQCLVTKVSRKTKRLLSFIKLYGMKISIQ